MSLLLLRLRLTRSPGAIALALIVLLGLLLAFHHIPSMPMENGHDGGASVEMAGAMICLGALAMGFMLPPQVGGLRGLRWPEQSQALPVASFTPRQALSAPARAGPARLQVLRL